MTTTSVFSRSSLGTSWMTGSGQHAVDKLCIGAHGPRWTWNVKMSIPVTHLAFLHQNGSPLYFVSYTMDSRDYISLFIYNMSLVDVVSVQNCCMMVIIINVNKGMHLLYYLHHLITCGSVNRKWKRERSQYWHRFNLFSVNHKLLISDQRTDTINSFHLCPTAY